MYLNCHSFHSLRYGTIPLAELVELGVSCGVSAMALTDINAISGVYDFIKLCREVDIKPVAGIEFRRDGILLYIGIAKSMAGLSEMNAFLSKHNLEEKPLPDVMAFKDAFTVYPLETAPEVLAENEWIGIRPDQLTQLVKARWRDRIDNMVILQPVTFRTKKEFNLHKILCAVDRNTLLSKLKPTDYCHPADTMTAEKELRERFRDYPMIVAQTEGLIARCTAEFDFKQKRNKKNYTQNNETDMQLLSRLAYQGLERRYGKSDKIAAARIAKELKVIEDLEFGGYFLITWDIIRYSNSMGFMHIGRGSGANSIVAYCLGITDICPIELDLYFERFLNPSRKSPPDFDIDWSWQERDTILNYIFDRYGRDHVAFCGTNVEFKYRSIFREVGKVFGLPKEELDQLAKNPMAKHDTNKVVKLVQEYGMMMEKYPNQRSMHACGILISEEPIINFSVLELPPKGFPIVQFDMHVAEDIGFDKFDILSQRGIGHINDTVKLIEKNRNIRVNIRNTALSKDEAVCNERLARGKTIGCFYIESPAMRGLLRRLKCDNYRTLVAASSIIRPGVAQSGMMKEYIFRHNNPDQFEYFHDVFKEQLGETYGIMVYQEDVIKIALHYGGLDASDGDILRRAMSGKGRSLAALQKVKDNFFESCARLGHPEQLSQEIYRQIESFAGYSFCKAHSASYAVESYQSLYLKVYYPVEFMVAVINNFGGFYRTEVYVHEARMSGATIHTPCINRSEMNTTLYGTDVYLGFIHLQGLPSKLSEDILRERERNGEFLSLEDFIARVPVGIESAQTLIFVGAFRFTGKTKNELLVTARLILVNFKPEDRGMLLFREPVKQYKLPELERSTFEDAFDEIELLGFPVSFTPFDLLKTNFRGDVMVKDLLDHYKKTVRMVAYLVSRKHVPTKKGDMYFGTWVDINGDFFDTAHFPDCLQHFPFQGGGCYLLMGVVEVDYHFPTITITKMAKLPFIPDPRYSNSNERQYRTHQQLKEDVSMTHRAPYPTEVNLPRKKMG